jgi:hypothetical protein
MKEDFPELTATLNELAFNFTSINLNKCTEDALEWYCERAINEINSRVKPQPAKVSFKEKIFSNIYLQDIGKVSYIPEVDEKITKFFDKMNEKLAELTRGIQTTKRNRNSTITIADRSYDVFKDLIFCYTSVAKAFEFIVMNRLPEGFILNVAGAVTKAGQDGAPRAIYESLYNYLEKDIEDLNNFLFKVSSNKDAEDCYINNILKLQHVAASSSTANTLEDSIPSASDFVETLLNSKLATDFTESWENVGSILSKAEFKKED